MTVTELLEQMDHAFGDMWEYDTMIHSLYKIRQKEGITVYSTCCESMRLWQ